MNIRQHDQRREIPTWNTLIPYQDRGSDREGEGPSGRKEK
jgi:hypothetical protein